MDAASLIDAIDGRAPGALERYGVPGLAVGVVSHGEQIERCYGVASLATGEPVRPETSFRIASITKPLVATLALCLVEDGRLALDEPLTGLRLPWRGITLRRLLSHSAGLAAEWPRSLADYGEGDDVLRRLLEDEAAPAPVEPGRLFSYSNAGYWVTGALIVRAAEMPLEKALRLLVLEPLGMERTDFVPAEPFVPTSLPYPRARRPSGGLYSTTTDLLAFAAHQLAGPGPLSPSSLREMQAAQIDVGPDDDYGLGWGLWRGRGRPTIEHGGGMPGFQCRLLLVPGEETAIVLLTNSDPGKQLIDELLDGVGLGLPLSPEVEVSGEQLAAVAGTYREPLGTTLRVAARDGGIELAALDEDGSPTESVHLRPASPTRFVVREGDDRGDLAEFFEDGRLLRYGCVFERVPG